MKVLCIFIFLISSCNGSKDLSSEIEITDSISQPSSVEYRDEMRNLVIKISTYSKAKKSNFAIIPQNGIELVTLNGEVSGALALDYLNAIDANGQESLFYGYNGDNKLTPLTEKDYTADFLTISQKNGNTILVTDYCSSTEKVADSYKNNAALGFVSYAAIERDLNIIPDISFPIYNENAANIESINQAKNFLYLLNLEKYNDKNVFLQEVAKTNYDVILMDLFFNDGQQFTKAEIDALKVKANGGRRLVISYMSIGEAEDYRYYWNSSWKTTNLEWLDAENPNWPGNYKVKYWNADWQRILLGTSDSYLDKILSSGFDGVYLDIIDGYEYFEEK